MTFISAKCVESPQGRKGESGRRQRGGSPGRRKLNEKKKHWNLGETRSILIHLKVLNRWKIHCAGGKGGEERTLGSEEKKNKSAAMKDVKRRSTPDAFAHGNAD